MNDLEIYKKAALVLRSGKNVALITVISTMGSTPGKTGYKMLVWGENAETLGTQHFASTLIFLHDFAVSKDDKGSFWHEPTFQLETAF